jgi:hypothetical protein
MGRGNPPATFQIDFGTANLIDCEEVRRRIRAHLGGA